MAAVTLGITACGPGPDPVPTDSLGSVLSGLSNDVTTVIQNATADAEATVLSVAGQVQDAIDNAESAFANDLDHSVNNIADAERSAVSQLQALVNDLQSGATDLLRTATADAQQLINSLPFTNKNPQVTSYTPRLTAAPSPSGSVEVTVNGNFVWAFQKQLQPSLHVGGTSYEPNELTTQQLGFSLPAAIFTSQPDALSPVSLELIAPYESGVIFKSVTPGTFHLLVTVLPPSPVKSLTLSTVTTQPGTATNVVTEPAGASSSGGGWHLDSFDCKDHDLTETISADNGWTIVPSTAQVTYIENKSPNAASVSLAVAQSSITVTARTKANCFLGVSDGSGDISFFVTFTEEQPVTKITPVTKTLTLGWGDQLVEPVTLHNWEVSATLFNGTVLQFSGTDNSHEYLSVLDQGTTVQISAPSTDNLNL